MVSFRQHPKQGFYGKFYRQHPKRGFYGKF
jgi:hypothetical protein